MVTFLTALSFFNALTITGNGVKSVDNINNSVTIDIGTFGYNSVSTSSYTILEYNAVDDDSGEPSYSHDLLQFDFSLRTNSYPRKATFTFDNAGLGLVNLHLHFVLYDIEHNSYEYFYTHDQQYEIVKNFSGPSSFHLYAVYSIYSRDDSSEFDIGYAQGYNDGYSTGIDEGLSTGYNNGYTAAMGTHNFTFTNLFASIADTPILMFRRLFSFELFGVDLLGVFLSLFTALIVIGLVKRFFH